jgi:colicin import membrane protein
LSAVAADVRPYEPRAQQNTPAAFVLALAMHSLLVLALWISVQWRVEPAGPVVVDLWGALPEPAVVAPPPPPPAVKAAPEPEKPDADIVLKQEKKKLEAERRLEEERRLEAERKLEAEKKRREAEAKRLEQEKKQLEAERKKQAEAMAQAEQLRREEEKREAVRRAEQARMLKQAGSGSPDASTAVAGSGRGDPTYGAQLIGLIRPRIVFAVPEGTSTSIYAEFQVDLLPTGEILAVRKLKASGLPGYDEAVERAIRRTDPFPRKRDGTVDRTVIIRFRPVDAQ